MIYKMMKRFFSFIKKHILAIFVLQIIFLTIYIPYRMYNVPRYDYLVRSCMGSKFNYNIYYQNRLDLENNRHIVEKTYLIRHLNDDFNLKSWLTLDYRCAWYFYPEFRLGWERQKNYEKISREIPELGLPPYSFENYCSLFHIWLPRYFARYGIVMSTGVQVSAFDPFGIITSAGYSIAFYGIKSVTPREFIIWNEIVSADVIDIYPLDAYSSKRFSGMYACVFHNNILINLNQSHMFFGREKMAYHNLTPNDSGYGFIQKNIDEIYPIPDGSHKIVEHLLVHESLHKYDNTENFSYQEYFLQKPLITLLDFFVEQDSLRYHQEKRALITEVAYGPLYKRILLIILTSKLPAWHCFQSQQSTVYKICYREMRQELLEIFVTKYPGKSLEEIVEIIADDETAVRSYGNLLMIEHESEIQTEKYCHSVIWLVVFKLIYLVFAFQIISIIKNRKNIF